MANYKNYKNEDIDLDVLIESLNENDLKLDLIRKNIIDPDQLKAVFNAMNDIVNGMKQGVVLVNSNKGSGLLDFSGVRSNKTDGPIDTYGHAAAFIGKKIREAKIIQQATQQAAQQEAQQTNTEEPSINLNHTSQEDINTDKQQLQEQQQLTEGPEIDEWASLNYGNVDDTGIKPVGDLSKIRTDNILYEDRVVLDKYMSQKSPELLGKAILDMIKSQKKSVTIKYNNKDHTFHTKYVIGYILNKLSTDNAFESFTFGNDILNFIPNSYYRNDQTGAARMLIYNISDKKIYSISAYNNPSFVQKVKEEYAKKYNNYNPLTEILK